MKIETKTKYEMLEVGDIIIEDDNIYLVCSILFEDCFSLIDLAHNCVEATFSNLEGILGALSDEATIIKAKDVKLVLNR